MNCQPFDLIALGATELKQKKAAGVGSDDLYQLKYTRRDSRQCDVSPRESGTMRARASLDNPDVGTLVGTSADVRVDHGASEMLDAWARLNPEQRQNLMELVRRMLS